MTSDNGGDSYPSLINQSLLTHPHQHFSSVHLRLLKSFYGDPSGDNDGGNGCNGDNEVHGNVKNNNSGRSTNNSNTQQSTSQVELHIDHDMHIRHKNHNTHITQDTWTDIESFLSSVPRLMWLKTMLERNECVCEHHTRWLHNHDMMKTDNAAAGVASAVNTSTASCTLMSPMSTSSIRSRVVPSSQQHQRPNHTCSGGNFDDSMSIMHTILQQQAQQHRHEYHNACNRYEHLYNVCNNNCNMNNMDNHHNTPITMDDVVIAELQSSHPTKVMQQLDEIMITINSDNVSNYKHQLWQLLMKTLRCVLEGYDHDVQGQIQRMQQPQTQQRQLADNGTDENDNSQNNNNDSDTAAYHHKNKKQKIQHTLSLPPPAHHLQQQQQPQQQDSNVVKRYITV